MIVHSTNLQQTMPGTASTRGTIICAGRLIVLMVLHFLGGCWEMKAKFYQSSSIVSSSSSHELTVQFNYMDIPVGSYLEISYPSVWGIGTLTGGNLTSDFCETSCNISAVQTVVNLATRTVQIKNLFTRPITPVQSRAIRYTLKNIINPPYSQSYTLLVKLLDSGSLDIDSASPDVTITAKQIVCSCSRTSTTVSVTTDYQFTVNPSSLSLPSNLNIIMAFPTIWSSSSEPGTYTNLACSSLINPAITCTLINGNINVSSVLVSSTSSPFSFTLPNVKNPGSQQSNNQLSFQFYTAGNQIAYCNVPIIGTTAKSLPDLTYLASGSLGSLTTAVVSFSITEKPKPTDIVQIELPKDYGCSKLYAAFVHLNAEIIGTQVTLNINSTNSSVTVLNLQPFSDSIALYHIKMYEIQIPKTTAAIPSIKLSIYRDGALVASQSCCSASFPYLQSTLGISVGLSTTAVGSSATHFIKINGAIALSFPNDYYYMMVILDSKYSLASSSYSCYVMSSQSIVDGLVCSRNSSTSILVTNFTSSNRIGSGVFTIAISSILTPVTLSSLTLSVITLDANYNGIENLTTTYSLSATKINSVVVTPALLSTYSTTSYTFTINNTNILSIGTIALIKFAPQVHIKAISLCYINGTQLLTQNCLIDTSSSTHLITINLGNSAQIGASGLTTTNITISQVLNPLSLSQTTTFSIQLVSNIGQIIEQLKEGIFVTMTSIATSFGYLSLVPADNHTMAITDYTVRFLLPLDVTQDYGSNSSYVAGGIKLVIIMPGQFSCLSGSVINSCLVGGESESMTYTLISTSTISNSSFTIRSMVNPSVTSISSIIVVRLYLSNYLSIEQNYNALTSFQPSLISYSLSQSGYYLAERTKIYLAIMTISNWVSSNTTKFIIITPPVEYWVDGSETITCNQVGTTITKTVATTGNLTHIVQVKINNISSLTNLSISIMNIFNPSTSSVSSGWAIELRETATGALIAISNSSTDATFGLICNLPCRSCMPNDSSACLSCYASISGIPEKYFDASAHLCRTNCLSSQYLPSSSADLTCESCSSTCRQCANVSDNCTGCNTGQFLYSPTNKCLFQCPPQFYKDEINHECAPCLSPCLHCSGSTGQICSFCVSGMLLTTYTNGTTTCTLLCPSAYYNNSNICTLCQNCITCSGPGYCTQCATGFYYYNHTCLTSCPNTYYLSTASNLTVCQICQPPCLTCIGNSTYCASCNTSTILNKYLYSTLNTSNCTNICPSQYYSTQDFICQPCTSPCLLCSSPTLCTSCVPGFYFFSMTQSCYSTCPNKTIPLSSPLRCQQCAQPCLECTGSINSCISCVEGYFLDSQLNQCNLTCNLPYFAINRQCARCQSPCSTCANLQVSVCTACISSYKLLGTSCYLSCPEGSYQSSPSSCSLCTSGCLTCQNSSSTCMSCFPGLYLYQHMCLPNCPTTPIFYYEYQMQCIACQPQCTNCISSPVECQSCSNSSLYLNEITRQCTSGCISPYYPGLNSTDMTTKLCVKCKLPCKTCGSTYSQCSSCYNGRYLLNFQCVRSCGTSSYPNSDLNACIPCSSNCLTCISQNSCTQCQAGTYFFQGSCYTVCPPAAHFFYLGKYCRNCALDNCLLCDSEIKTELSCLLCEPGYYLYNKKCQAQCPVGYEIDLVTKSLCIVSSNFALLIYLQKLQNFKAYAMPGTGALLVCLVLLWIHLFRRHNINPCVAADGVIHKTLLIKMNAGLALLGAPQLISLVGYLVYLVLKSESYHIPSLMRVAYFGAFGLFYIFNTITLCLVLPILRTDAIFLEWRSQSLKNSLRLMIIMVSSVLVNNKISFLLFSGLWRIPVTCCQISGGTLQILSKRLRIIYLCNMFIVEVPMMAYAIYTLILQDYALTDYRLFYGSLDITCINIICIVVELIFIARGLQIASPYKKYILEKVSNHTVAAWSEKVPEQLEEDEQINLHKSNSAQALRESEEMKAIEYKTVFDTQDFEDPEYVQPFKLEIALDQGKFRKKNLKRKRKNGQNLQLGVIEEDSQESAENKAKKTKKQSKIRKSKVGYMKNFIYWKPPQKKEKKQPLKEFKMHEKQIMQTIRQKQSDFDAITQNDFIFQERASLDNSSHDSDPNFEIEDSRRALNFQYETFINKNYAQRRHLK